MDALPPPPPVPGSSSRSPPHLASSSPHPAAASRTEPGIQDALARDFPKVAQVPRDDLQLLLEDPAYFDAYFNTMPQSLAYHQAVEQKMRDNIELAEKSTAMKPDLERLREDTARLFNEANDLKTRWAYLDDAQREAYRRFSQPAQQARYRAATTQQEHLSDSLVAAFLAGEGDDESFVKQYREVRKVYHKREIGLRKWDEGKVVWM
ncbi:vacuolar protein sorting family 37 protein [Rhodotorula paludigena]|uniref:vacuolar protein sorting family 37 protein n=1 Tax=Rhodotorula paludigena TaxID=86838 RepID=UPI0031768E4C